MMKLKFTILGNPVTKKNSQRIIKVMLKNGRYYNKILPSKAFEKYQKDCAYFMPLVDKPIDFPINMQCVYFMDSRRKVDLLNLLNATADILVDYGILEDDNSKIVYSTDGSVVLYDKENPRVEVEISELEEIEVQEWKS